MKGNKKAIDLESTVERGMVLEIGENKKDRIYLEKLFLIIAILVGSLLVILTPPMAVPDENAHFINAYAVSKGNFFADTENGQIGIYMPKTFSDFINNNLKKFSNFENKQTFAQYYFDSWLQQDMSQGVFYATSLRRINPVGYLVSGLGMAIGSFVCGAFALPYNLLLSGRIFNLVFYIIVVYFAIKITPIFKRTMILLSLMPMSIFLAASLSYDAILIPISFLLFAYALKLITAREDYLITKRDIAVILLITFFLAGIKAAYLPFLLILFAIPRKFFGTKKRYFICIALVMVVGLTVYGVPQICNKIATSGIVLNSTKYVSMQKMYLKSHISEIPYIIINTFKHLKTFYLTGFFGILGLLDTNFPIPIIICFYLILLFVFLIDASKGGYFKWNIKVLSIISIMISLCGMLYHAYTNWTSQPQILGIGANYVSGLQGRYFIPIALFICLLFSNSFLQKHPIKYESIINRKADMVVTFTPAVLGLLTVTTVLLRFWC